ncbi:uncharacterized protein LOC132733458 [Ruditapes philippinarum]|uniref:uncharacterized protein LOC132733458 n=1 Tax=Ruditapes philippinarum TaxID=129788 RepID=UPI00295BB59B|nr:uncharacterized protein LOC132733458 [Ruditapes philippinarum]
MQNKYAAGKLLFHLDLCEQALCQIEFLRTIDTIQDLKEPSVLRRAVYRYEKYWLPLAIKYPNRCLAAPLDIEWAWHCHMLCPKSYETDCQTLVGGTVDHMLRPLNKFKEEQKESQKLWFEMYSEDYEPFTVDYSAPYNADAIDRFKSKITYDIVAAAQRQTVFYYQVSLPHYRDKKFLQNSLQRYERFLYLKTQLPKAFMVPCYDIDLMWHTHQLNPLSYKKDMVKIIGHLFNHDDSVNDRSKGSKLSEADKKTRESWNSFYNENYSLFGAMYRGTPPVGFLHKISPNESYTFCTKRTIITFENLTLNLPLTDPDKYKKLKLTVSSAAGPKVVKNWFSLKRPGDVPSCARTITWKINSRNEIDTKESNSIKFFVQERTGWAFCGSKTDVGSNTLNMLPQIESIANAVNGGRINAQIPLGSSNITLDVQGQFSAPKKGKALLFLDSGRYETAVIPENVKQLWGPVSLERLPAGTDNHCQVASHRLKNHLGNVELTVRTIHSEPLMMSVIQVYFHDKMAVIGHLIASDQLPLPTQVSDLKHHSYVLHTIPPIKQIYYNTIYRHH